MRAHEHVRARAFGCSQVQFAQRVVRLQSCGESEYTVVADGISPQQQRPERT